jgi:hypothetical protein
MMKQFALTALLAGVVACMAPSKAAAADVTLTFTPFCDYMTISEGGNMLWGTHVQTACGLSNANAIGSYVTIGNNILINPPFTSASFGYTISSWVNSPDALIYVFDQDTLECSNYEWTGSEFELFNTFPYTVRLTTSI